ncbi:hypothetical protein AB0A94_36185 [Streptomyces sp. NPDC044984]|uniref:hypothetical protein n=1 Tax=Streptomyces sp. NPDC044984 TaxID=3154335 RepID=UPI0033E0F268
MLWIGTPAGTLFEVDVEAQEPVTHAVLTGSRISALAATATGELLVAGSEGELVLLSVPNASTQTGATNREVARAAVVEFLETTTEVPDDGTELESHLVVTDGTRTWEADDLAKATEADTTDPTWLQIQAAVNKIRTQSE